MDVAHPIRGIVPSLDAPVLEVLATTSDPLSGREIQRQAGTGSHRGVQLVLRRLVIQGIILAEPRGNAVYYTANRRHLAWPAIEQMVQLRTILRERLEATIKDWAIKPRHASLYGAAARGDGDAHSDIDILLVRPKGAVSDARAWDVQLVALREAATAWTGNAIQIFDLEETRLAEHVAARDPMVADWLAEGEILAGTPLGTLIAGLPRPVAARASAGRSPAR